MADITRKKQGLSLLGLIKFVSTVVLVLVMVVMFARITIDKDFARQTVNHLSGSNELVVNEGDQYEMNAMYAHLTVKVESHDSKLVLAFNRAVSDEFCMEVFMKIKPKGMVPRQIIDHCENRKKEDQIALDLILS
jgi:hypothetical protein